MLKLIGLVLSSSLLMSCDFSSSIKVGDVPNDLALLKKNNDIYALVISSNDAELQIFNLSAADLSKQVVKFFPDDKNTGARPWSLALSPNNDRVAVSLYDQDKIALVDLWSQKILKTAAAEINGIPVLVPVQLTKPLRKVFDAQKNGILSTEFKYMALRSPQGLAFVEDFVALSFANVLESAGMSERESASYGPGVVALFANLNDELSFHSFIELPFQNPGAISSDGTGGLWISCSGLFGMKDARWQAVSEGGLVRAVLAVGPKKELLLERVLAFGGFAPAKIVFSENYIIVPSQTMAAVWIAKKNASQFSEGKITYLRTKNQMDLTNVSLLEGDRIAVSINSSNKIISYQIGADLLAKKDGHEFELYEKNEDSLGRGASTSAFIKKEGVFFGAVLLNISAELITLNNF